MKKNLLTLAVVLVMLPFGVSAQTTNQTQSQGLQQLLQLLIRELAVLEQQLAAQQATNAKLDAIAASIATPAATTSTPATIISTDSTNLLIEPHFTQTPVFSTDSTGNRHMVFSSDQIAIANIYIGYANNGATIWQLQQMYRGTNFSWVVSSFGDTSAEKIKVSLTANGHETDFIGISPKPSSYATSPLAVVQSTN